MVQLQLQGIPRDALVRLLQLAPPDSTFSVNAPLPSSDPVRIENVQLMPGRISVSSSALQSWMDDLRWADDDRQAASQSLDVAPAQPPVAPPPPEVKPHVLPPPPLPPPRDAWDDAIDPSLGSAFAPPFVPAPRPAAVAPQRPAAALGVLPPHDAVMSDPHPRPSQVVVPFGSGQVPPSLVHAASSALPLLPVVVKEEVTAPAPLASQQDIKPSLRDLKTLAPVPVIPRPRRENAVAGPSTGRLSAGPNHRQSSVASSLDVPVRPPQSIEELLDQRAVSQKLPSALSSSAKSLPPPARPPPERQLSEAPPSSPPAPDLPEWSSQPPRALKRKASAELEKDGPDKGGQSGRPGGAGRVESEIDELAESQDEEHHVESILRKPSLVKGEQRATDSSAKTSSKNKLQSPSKGVSSPIKSRYLVAEEDLHYLVAVETRFERNLSGARKVIADRLARLAVDLVIECPAPDRPRVLYLTFLFVISLGHPLVTLQNVQKILLAILDCACDRSNLITRDPPAVLRKCWSNFILRLPQKEYERSLPIFKTLWLWDGPGGIRSLLDSHLERFKGLSEPSIRDVDLLDTVLDSRVLYSQKEAQVHDGLDRLLSTISVPQSISDALGALRYKAGQKNRAQLEKLGLGRQGSVNSHPSPSPRPSPSPSAPKAAFPVPPSQASVPPPHPVPSTSVQPPAPRSNPACRPSAATSSNPVVPPPIASTTGPHVTEPVSSLPQSSPLTDPPSSSKSQASSASGPTQSQLESSLAKAKTPELAAAASQKAFAATTLSVAVKQSPGSSRFGKHPLPSKPPEVAGPSASSSQLPKDLSQDVIVLSDDDDDGNSIEAVSTKKINYHDVYTNVLNECDAASLNLNDTVARLQAKLLELKQARPLVDFVLDRKHPYLQQESNAIHVLFQLGHKSDTANTAGQTPSKKDIDKNWRQQVRKQVYAGILSAAHSTYDNRIPVIQGVIAQLLSASLTVDRYLQPHFDRLIKRETSRTLSGYASLTRLLTSLPPLSQDLNRLCLDGLKEIRKLEKDPQALIKIEALQKRYRPAPST